MLLAAISFLDGLAIFGGWLAVVIILLAAWVVQTFSSAGNDFDRDGGAE